VYILRKRDIMTNLTRYDVRRDLQDYYNDCEVVDIKPTGEFVKFEDVKEFLKPHTNTQSGPCLSCIGFVKSVGVNYCKRCGRELPVE
jgi:hypothetical protein